MKWIILIICQKFCFYHLGNRTHVPISVRVVCTLQRMANWPGLLLVAPEFDYQRKKQHFWHINKINSFHFGFHMTSSCGFLRLFKSISIGNLNALVKNYFSLDIFIQNEEKNWSELNNKGLSGRQASPSFRA